MINLNQLQNFFLTPEWLLLSLAIIPLLIIYLIKPSPKEQLMPSLEFFDQGKNQGKLRKALNRLLANLLLILHILIITTAAFAAAQPFETTMETQEKSVIVLDTSLPTEEHLDEIRNFAADNTGEETTIISANDGTEVIAEGVNQQEAINEIENMEYEEVEQNIGDAVELADNFEGQLVISSNFASLSQEEVGNLLSENILTLSTEFENELGIVEKELEDGEATITVRNYQDQNLTSELDINGQEEELYIEGNGVNTFTFELQEGENTVNLQDSQFEADSELFIYSQESRTTDIYLQNNDFYLETVFDVIGDINMVDNIQESDVAVINQQSDSNNYAEEVSEDQSLIYTREGLEGLNGFENVETEVEVVEPTAYTLSGISILENEELEVNQSWTQPEYAMAEVQYEGTEMYVFSIEQEDIRYEPVFPTMWRELIFEATEAKKDSELNKRLPYLNQGNEITERGFNDIEGNTYAFNTFQTYDPVNVEGIERSDMESEETQKESRQNLLISLLLLLLILDSIYLVYKGDLRF